jgi:hypothetical protein
MVLPLKSLGVLDLEAMAGHLAQLVQDFLVNARPLALDHHGRVIVEADFEGVGARVRTASGEHEACRVDKTSHGCSE